MTNDEAGTAKVQGVVATPACWIEVRCSLSASAGVFQPRVLRGLLLRAAAMAEVVDAEARQADAFRVPL